MLHHSSFSWFEHWSSCTILISPNLRNTYSAMQQWATVYVMIDLWPFGQSKIVCVSLSDIKMDRCVTGRVYIAGMKHCKQEMRY